jgi:hypothetical protein
VAQFLIVDVITQTHSDETNQDSEPSIGVNPANPDRIVVSAFTPPDAGQANGPLFVSVDGGQTWNMSFVAPNGMPLDQTFKFDGMSGELYGGTIDGASDPFFAGTVLLDELRTNDPFTNTAMAILESPQPTPTDQPFIAAVTVRAGPDAGKTRTYTGYNDQRVSGGTGQTSAVEICLDAMAATPIFTTAHIEKRATPVVDSAGDKQDGPQVRTAPHLDGTVYAVFSGWRTFDPASAASNTWHGFTTDVVVVRDDTWASGATPFTDLKDPGDMVAGLRLAQGVALDGSQLVGQQRVAGSLAIAVHPADSNIVYVCWAGPESGAYTLHLQRSLNRGVTWSGVLLQISNAINPALAIATNGRIGFLYQQLTGSGASQRWETHFRDSTNGTTWSDTTLCTTPANVPVTIGQPYIGDYADLIAVGKNFYGAFCANNTPDPANFPTVMARYLRNVTTSAPWNLLGTNGVTVVNPSIDPFFVKAIEVDAASDFIVRDWTDTATSFDTGVEPSTHLNFWSTSDVWNQVTSTTAFTPNANDQIIGEMAAAGAGTAGQNYAFARIRRATLPPAGSGSKTVSAHFLVSEFGTGSNFVDWLFSDPTDPDLSFPSMADVSVTFSDTDLGPLITPPFEWDLAETVSDHCCLAVEIYAPGDPFSAPGLTGRAPGTSGATLAVINDNNKAQRNLGVYAGTTHIHGAIYYGIVHNAATFRRDLILVLPFEPGRPSPPKGTMIEVVTAEGVVERHPWEPWRKITLAGMEPGENRWLGLSLPVAETGEGTIVHVAQLQGDLPVNGFGVAAARRPPDVVIGELVEFERKVLRRLEAAFDVAGAGDQLGVLNAAGGDREPPERGEGGALDVDERLRVEADDLTIEIDVRVRRGEDERKRHPRPHRPPRVPSAKQYEDYLRANAESLATLAATLGAGRDPFAIQESLAGISSAAEGDVASLTALHATALRKLDAFMTMLQKERGDRADIVQMVAWHADLCAQSAVLAGLSSTDETCRLLEAFLVAVDARTVRLGDYQSLIRQLGPRLRAGAGEMGAAGALGPLIDAMIAATSARGAESPPHLPSRARRPRLTAASASCEVGRRSPVRARRSGRPQPRSAFGLPPPWPGRERDMPGRYLPALADDLLDLPRTASRLIPSNSSCLDSHALALTPNRAAGVWYRCSCDGVSGSILAQDHHSPRTVGNPFKHIPPPQPAEQTPAQRGGPAELMPPRTPAMTDQQ